MTMLAPLLALSIVPLTEPEQTNPFIVADAWIQGTLLGSIATAIAVIAVAVLGFLLLAGRLQVRRGLTVIAGCFVLFGARTIADGIVMGFGAHSATTSRDMAPSTIEAPSPLSNAFPTPTPSHVPYDPYASAAVPQHH